MGDITERDSLHALASTHGWSPVRNAVRSSSTVSRGQVMVCMSFDRERRFVGAARFRQRGEVRPGIPLWSFVSRTDALAQTMRWLHAEPPSVLRANSVHNVNA